MRKGDEMKKNVVECECYMFTDAKGMRGIKPVYMTEHAACADVALPNDVEVPAKSYVIVPLLIGFEIPQGWKVLLYARSSLLKNYGILTQTGVIDHDYSGQPIHAILYNVGDSTVQFKRGERILQAECSPAYDCAVWERRKEARTSGLGSTGAKI